MITHHLVACRLAWATACRLVALLTGTCLTKKLAALPCLVAALVQVWHCPQAVCPVVVLLVSLLLLNSSAWLLWLNLLVDC